MGPAPEELINFTVSDLLLPDRNEWDIAKIQRILPFEEQRILAIKPSLTGAPDKLSWLSTDTGNYSTKTGYAAVLSSQSTEAGEARATAERSTFDWRKNVWKLQTTPKIKLFIWKTLHGAIPTGEALRSRGINVDGLCKRCKLPESIDHLLLHCSYARQVWTSAPVYPGVEYNGSIELRSFWPDLCLKKTLPPTGVSMGALAPWIVWQLWLARNKLVFEDKIITIEEVVSKAVASAREWITSQDKLTQPTRPIAPPTMIQADYVLLRTDAAWNESLNLAGLGWMTKRQGRDSSFSSIAHHVTTPLAAEGLALREALLKCMDIGLSKIRCESDSTTLIKAINANSPLVGLYDILADINSIASSFESISFNWISRERNSIADGLAKNVLSTELAFMALPNVG